MHFHSSNIVKRNELKIKYLNVVNKKMLVFFYIKRLKNKPQTLNIKPETMNPATLKESLYKFSKTG